MKLCTYALCRIQQLCSMAFAAAAACRGRTLSVVRSQHVRPPIAYLSLKACSNCQSHMHWLRNKHVTCVSIRNTFIV